MFGGITDMSLSFADAAKAKQLREYFNRHGRVYIVVDATREDVLVPDHLRGDPALRLVLNVRMPQIIRIHDDAVVSDFSFSGQIFSCCIPMHTIWASYLPEGELEQGIIWDDSVPEMIKAIVAGARSAMSDEQATGEEQGTVVDQAKAAPVSIAAVDSAPSGSAGMTVIEGGAKKEPAEKTRKTSHLRVVK